MIDTLHEIFEAVSYLLIKQARKQRNPSISFEGSSYKAWNLDDSTHLSRCFCSPLVFQSTAYLKSKWFFSPVWLFRFHTDFQDLFKRMYQKALHWSLETYVLARYLCSVAFTLIFYKHISVECYWNDFLGQMSLAVYFNVCKWLRREVPSINRALLKGDMCALSFRLFSKVTFVQMKLFHEIKKSCFQFARKTDPSFPMLHFCKLTCKWRFYCCLEETTING